MDAVVERARRRRRQDDALTINPRHRPRAVAAIVVLTLWCGVAAGQEPAKPAGGDDNQDLAKQAQNPIANLISVP